MTPLIAALAGLFPDVDPGPRRRAGTALTRKCTHAVCAWSVTGGGAHRRPEFVPPRQRKPKRAGSVIEQFAEVRRLGATVPQAARAVGIPEYAGWRYELRLRNAPQREAS